MIPSKFFWLYYVLCTTKCMYNFAGSGFTSNCCVKAQPLKIQQQKNHWRFKSRGYFSFVNSPPLYLSHVRSTVTIFDYINNNYHNIHPVYYVKVQSLWKARRTCGKQLRTFEIKLDTSDLIAKHFFHIKSCINMYCKHTCSPATVGIIV